VFSGIVNGDYSDYDCRHNPDPFEVRVQYHRRAIVALLRTDYCQVIRTHMEALLWVVHLCALSLIATRDAQRACAAVTGPGRPSRRRSLRRPLSAPERALPRDSLPVRGSTVALGAVFGRTVLHSPHALSLLAAPVALHLCR
jgi:hypothetical protein